MDNDELDNVQKQNFVGQLLGRGGEKKQFPNNLRLLIEIVSATNLPIAGKVYRDKNSRSNGDYCS